ncbi:LTA synthase family protein [Planomicrobium sp. YIM 101495]|uniref:LTA synthase family protein n=1 Tax=Planomicrobium sp. YIM 101495 TaxID=2665160 RepID=UPI0012B7DD72|nr:LTA synthase family protein [Planomicrobium sp. YIM 101495]MTD31397.1 sulfatase-like hydrolase/transferase [Planomicrobium sp. YIM 101495]
MKLTPKLWKVLLVVAGILYFAFAAVAAQAFLGEGFEQANQWKKDRPSAYYLNVLILIAVFFIFLGLFNRFVISFLATHVVAGGLVVISFYKFGFLGENLYPWDLLLYSNVFNLLPNLLQEVNAGALLLGLAVVVAGVSGLIAYWWMKRPKPLFRLKWWARVPLLLLAAVFLCLFVFYRSIPGVEAGLKDRAEVTNITWDQNKNYAENGFFLTFLLNMQSAIIWAPSGYNERAIEEIMARLEAEQSPSDAEAPAQQPNIIFIMSESFWDPTLLEGARFEPDPMPFVREHQNGALLSPTFGGGTSNVEFELLTGFTNMFLPTGSVPYQQYIKSEIPALPNYLADKGYKPLAIHPYPKWFWNREEVYEHMGFEEFIDIDGFEDPLYKGPFVSDAQVTETIIEQIEAADEPVFIHAVTMQNHTSYNEDKYEEFTVETEVPEGVDPVLNLLLRSFTQGVQDADAAFAELAAYAEASDEPTLIVFFGDHLPAIGPDYKLFKQTDFVPRGVGESAWELDDFRKMRSTPLAIWNNYGADVPELGTVSPNTLASVALDLAGVDKPLFYKAVDLFRDVMPGYTVDVKVDADDELYRITPDEVEALKQDYELLQYDRLFGEQYSSELKK